MDVSTLTTDDIAEHCGVSAERLRRFAECPRLLLQGPRPKRVKHKIRQVYKPTRLGRHILGKLNRLLQRLIPPSKIVHGGAKRRSCFTAAERHLGKLAVITNDVFECYPSITPQHVHASLLDAGVTEDTAELVVRLTTIDGHLPQGSPTSSTMLNVVLRRIDHAISAKLNEDRMFRNADIR